MSDYSPYADWASHHNQWVATLKELQRCPARFSFTEKLAAPEEENIYASGDSHLFITRRQEYHDEATWYSKTYEQLWAVYTSGLDEYLAIGEKFLRHLTDPGMTLMQKHDLMVEAQGDHFLMHNAAVRWLEEHPASDLGKCQDYEEVLKVLWLDTLRDGHREWRGRKPTKRQQRLLTYLLGRDDQDVIPAWNDPRLPQIREASHVTLGKVILTTHSPIGRWMHPCYWGLFLVSPLHDGDRGFYIPDADDPDHKWVTHLANDFRLESRYFRHHPNEFQVYEIAPRPYGNPAYATSGIYLNRSQAHGRDDFLTLVPEPGGTPAVTLVFCTKGVGSDPDLIGSETARNLDFVKRFKNRFAAPTTQYPFAYPLNTDRDVGNAGSWRNIGFCTTYAGDEISIVDFTNFGTMYDRATVHPRTRDCNGFVQPVALVEINSLPRTQARMPDIQAGINSELIGYPVQVVTVSPIETCLRLSKEGKPQDYILGNLALEVDEWERCYSSVPLPSSLIKALADDVGRARRRHPQSRRSNRLGEPWLSGTGSGRTSRPASAPYDARRQNDLSGLRQLAGLPRLRLGYGQLYRLVLRA